MQLRKDVVGLVSEEVDPDIERLRIAREIRREHWRNEWDLGFTGKPSWRTESHRKEFIDNKLREEGLL